MFIYFHQCVFDKFDEKLHHFDTLTIFMILKIKQIIIIIKAKRKRKEKKIKPFE